MLSHTLVRKKKKEARKVTMKNFLLKRANQMLFNGLAHCNKVMLSNCPFHVLTRDLGENATAKVFFNVFIDDAYIDKIIPYAHPKGIKCSQQPEWKFQHISGWTFSLKSMNFVSWQCTGILTSLSKAKKKNPKALLHDSREIFTSCKPDCRWPKQSPLQSSPPCYLLEAKVYQSKEKICIVKSETFHLGIKIGLFSLMTGKK